MTLSLISSLSVEHASCRRLSSSVFDLECRVGDEGVDKLELAWGALYGSMRIESWRI